MQRLITATVGVAGPDIPETRRRALDIALTAALHHAARAFAADHPDLALTVDGCPVVVDLEVVT